MGAPATSRRAVILVTAAIAGAAIASAAWVGWKAYRFERHLAFARHPLGGASAEQSGLPGAIDVEYGRSGGAPLRGWYAPSTHGAAIVLVHGAGGDRRDLAREAALLRGAGYGVLLVDLPGTGGSGGRFTGGRAEEAAVVAAVDWLARQGVARIGGLSFSLGSIFLARVAGAEPRLRAVVLEAPSTSIIDRIRATHGRHAWLRTLPATIAWFQEGTDPWREDARETLPAMGSRPLLLITGTRDAMASPEMARELAARAGPSARVETFETGHGGYWEADAGRYSALLLSFFRSAL